MPITIPPGLKITFSNVSGESHVYGSTGVLIDEMHFEVDPKTGTLTIQSRKEGADAETKKA